LFEEINRQQLDVQGSGTVSFNKKVYILFMWLGGIETSICIAWVVGGRWGDGKRHVHDQRLYTMGTGMLSVHKLSRDKAKSKGLRVRNFIGRRERRAYEFIV
jgi:hypothetical protein